MHIYCLRCKTKTESTNPKIIKGERKNRISALCAKCGTKKSQFIANKSESGTKKNK